MQARGDGRVDSIVLIIQEELMESDVAHAAVITMTQKEGNNEKPNVR